ncbi:hypothetical protein H0A36_25735 [Endozoicomonas sp. SM1973]|uniref:Uncharacterized protein n=1 Tax=Spartinivicinus marinus TaxID=2994442 RepID=A0A853IHA9_9GAMM|nr:hypothetical protein [Spartinivicinus marinus]MCX4030365.1 hypothetical protein [Spartinivicinus marinus]MCX4030465.1 hypothetical protein [Spartinivicinus marinus]NYZ69421.1 hypothetical protein [Spartinivicinus marinus]
MTPLDLLADIKAEFSLLLLDDEVTFLTLLKRSCRTYHDSIGFQKTMVLTPEQLTEGVEAPDDYEGLLTAYDERQQPAPIILHGNTLIYKFGKKSAGDVTVIYFSDLTRWDFNKDHFPPHTKVSFIHSHLHGLISLANNERLRGMHQAAELSADHLPVEADIRGQLTELEAIMKEHPPFLTAAQLSH